MTKITIEPPCNVGDLLFCIFSHRGYPNDTIHYEVVPCRVVLWQYYSHGSFLISAKSMNNQESRYIEIGETAFWTCEEAEKELLRLRGEK